MTTIITTIIITLVAHSAIGCILYLATKNNEGVLAYWGAGILCLFTNAITAIIYGIRKATHRKYFKALLVDEEGKLYYCESKQADDIRFDVEEYKDLDLKFAREIVESRNYNPAIKKLVKGLMIESYIEDGAQKIGEGVYGQSITDPCLGWEKTERLIEELDELPPYHPD